MRFYYSDNPLRDYEDYEAEQEREIAKLPKCTKCKEHIQDEFCYEVDGEVLCEDCMNDMYRKDTDSLID